MIHDHLKSKKNEISEVDKVILEKKYKVFSHHDTRHEN